MQAFFSILILLAGLSCGWFYLRRPPMPSDSPLQGHRPWRRVGAGICVALGIMFAFGVFLLDEESVPSVFAAYWIIMLGLVLWLCMLAVKDLLYTRRLIAEWRVKRLAPGKGLEKMQRMQRDFLR